MIAGRPSIFGEFTTLSQMVRSIPERTRSACALNMRVDDAWEHVSTERFSENVRRLAIGLGRLGIRKGDTVGILARPSPHWMMFDLAAIVAGAVTVPLFSHISPANLKFEIRDAGLKAIFVEGEDAWSVIEPHAARLKRVLTRGIPTRLKNQFDIESVQALGDEGADDDPCAFHALCDRADPDDIATIIYTSGSTGVPKGVELTHRNLVSQIQGAALRFPLDPAQDCALSCLPLAHVFERMVTYYYLACGVRIYFADDVKNVGPLLRDVRPTILTLVPRLLEKMYLKIVGALDDATTLQQKIGRWALAHAEVQDHEEGARGWKLQVADPFVYRKLRDAVGGRLRRVIVGGAALSPNLHRFFLNVGVPLYVGYGLTEAAPVLAVNYPRSNRVGTVGRAYPGVELALSDEGEIIARGPNVMVGYRNDGKATARAIDGEHWLHTGDRGTIDDDGYVTITGRMKELYKTSNGKYVCPVPIEQALSLAPMIDTTMLIAEGRPYVTCLLFPDADYLQAWKRREGVPDVSDEAFLASDVVTREIERLVEKVNDGLNRWERVRRYRFVTAPISVETGELTPTLKVRRHVVAERYASVIETMYADRPVAPALGESDAASKPADGKAVNGARNGGNGHHGTNGTNGTSGAEQPAKGGHR